MPIKIAKCNPCTVGVFGECQTCVNVLWLKSKYEEAIDSLINNKEVIVFSKSIKQEGAESRMVVEIRGPERLLKRFMELF